MNDAEPGEGETTPGDAGQREHALGELRARLAEAGDPAVKEWWERYMKGVIPFRGVPLPQVRSIVYGWWREWVEPEPLPAQKELAFRLFDSDWSEDKLAGILAFERLAPRLEPSDLRYFEQLFESGLLHDWGNTDWLCVKVLHKLVLRGAEFADPIAAWAGDERAPLWQRRAGVVAFVQTAKHGDPPPNDGRMVDRMLAAAAETLGSRDRFLQTGAGWLIREISRGNRERAVAFIREHLRDFSREGLRYAVEKLPEPDKALLLGEWESAQPSRRARAGA